MRIAIKKALPTIIMMIIGILIYIMIPSQVKAFSDDGVTTRTVPYIMSLIIIAANFLSSIITIIKTVKEQCLLDKAGKETPNRSKNGLFRVALAVLAISLWLILLKPVGFPVMTCLLCAFLMVLAGSRKVLSVVLVSVISTGILYYVFKFLLYTPLPAGIFFV